MPLFPFNILAPITLGRKGPKGDPSTWDDLTGKPSTFTPATHNHPSSDVTILGPYPNDAIASGCAYFGNLQYGLVIYAVTAGTAGNSKQVVIGSRAIMTSPLEVITTANLLTIYLQLVGYNPVTTIQQLVTAINFDNVAPSYFFAVAVSFGGSDVSTSSLTNLSNGVNTPPVNVGSLYYTADGSVKRRMS